MDFVFFVAVTEAELSWANKHTCRELVSRLKKALGPALFDTDLMRGSINLGTVFVSFFIFALV